MRKTKVIVVDGSKFIRTLFSSLLNEANDIEVVETASDPYEAGDKIKQLAPDVILLSIDLPKMDGISFLDKIMTHNPTPVIMVSSLTHEAADITLKALELGAVDYITKPIEARLFTDLDGLRVELAAKVRNAVGANIKSMHLKAISKNPLEFTPSTNTKHKVIAIGASTGGVEAIRQVMLELPANIPPVVITQHMPEKFTEAFAKRLDNLTKVNVHEARNGQKLHVGNVYVAPGGKQMSITGDRTSGYTIKIDDSEPVAGNKPSIDHLFESIAKTCGSDAIGVILTGNGADGAEGMLKMKQSGAFNIGQNKDSCVVYEMPKAANENQSVDIELPLQGIAAEVLKHCV